MLQRSGASTNKRHLTVEASSERNVHTEPSANAIHLSNLAREELRSILIRDGVEPTDLSDENVEQFGLFLLTVFVEALKRPGRGLI